MKKYGNTYIKQQIKDIIFYKRSDGIFDGKNTLIGYTFDFKGKVFRISITDNLPSHESLLKKILGI